jgi:hypothetical protein
MAMQWTIYSNGALRNISNYKELDPSRVGPELQKHVTNEAALEAAKNRRNVLHNHLEWDDATCGVIHRLGQIASLRSCVRLYDDERDETVRAFISLADDADRYRSRYYSRQEVIDSVEIQRQLLRKWIARFEAFQQDMREMEDLCQAAREFGEVLKRRLDSFEAARP